MSSQTRIALIGFGEVGQILAQDLQARGFTCIAAWDLLFADPQSAPSRAAAGSSTRAASSAGDAVRDAEIVLSAVTAAQALHAIDSVLGHLPNGAVLVDLNSASPGVKQRGAERVASVGARYVEAAIMAPIGPKRIGSPILLGGPHAAPFLPLARDLGFAGAEVFSERVGRASAAKMCRSVVVKGVEALLAESLLSARRYGVEDTVMDSLENLFPAADWRKLARYMISRSLVHGRRRAEEMREVAQTVAEAGFDPWMSTATVNRQAWAAQFKDAAREEDLTAMLDRLLAEAGNGERSC